MSGSDELKPCPWCNAPAYVEVVDYVYQATCHHALNCPAYSLYLHFDQSPLGRENLVKLWNRRGSVTEESSGADHIVDPSKMAELKSHCDELLTALRDLVHTVEGSHGRVASKHWCHAANSLIAKAEGEP